MDKNENVVNKEGILKTVDVAILGGGSAGSLAATLLGKKGISTILVDIRQSYPPDFRCEKIHEDQTALIKKIGLADVILPAATPITEVWVARRGHIIAKKHGEAGAPYEYGIAYDTLVNTIRQQIPDNVQFIWAKVDNILTSSHRQTITLSNGETWSARLVVAATGLNNVVPDRITRSEIAKCFSVSVGFDLASKTGFKFPALTWFAEKPGPIGYVSIFPIGARMRANIFAYHNDIRHPWCQAVRSSPLSTIHAAMPRLQSLLGDVELVSDVRVRPVDLYASLNHKYQPGLVLIGDNFSTSCPAAGTGVNKVLTDVDQLCNVYIPTWLTTPGMDIEKIQSYYNDPVKVACEEWSLREAYYHRSLASDTTLPWRIRRMGWLGLDVVGTRFPKLKEMPQRLFDLRSRVETHA